MIQATLRASVVSWVESTDLTWNSYSTSDSYQLCDPRHRDYFLPLCTLSSFGFRVNTLSALLSKFSFLFLLHCDPNLVWVFPKDRSLTFSSLAALIPLTMWLTLPASLTTSILTPVLTCTHNSSTHFWMKHIWMITELLFASVCLRIMVAPAF